MRSSCARAQRTICRTVAVHGFGYWHGESVTVQFHPAPIDHGIVFKRGDLASDSSPGTDCAVPVAVDLREEVPRRTCLVQGEVRVDMVEHLLAALAGLEIDNCLVVVDHAEMPGCDGSSGAFVAALDQAGIESQSACVDPLIVRERVRIGDDHTWVEARPGSSGLAIEYRLDYGETSPIGRQELRVEVTPETFRRELSAARTFLLLEEAQYLAQQGLGTGTTVRDLLVFDAHGPIDNQLRFADECVRHKILDVVGDLALAGRPVVGEIIACRSGHRLNAELVRAIFRQQDSSGRQRRSA